MKQLIAKLYNFLVLLSPRVEVMFRQLYWNNIKHLKKLSPNKHTPQNKESATTYINFKKITDYLKEQGVGEGTLLVVHSSYESLENTHLSPEEIIEELLKIVGKTGTLAMPVIRRYKGEPKLDDVLTANVDFSKLICTYDVKKTLVTTGLLPYTLMNHENSVTSRHPLNPMTAVGALAKEMMENNLKGYKPSPHGANSSWKFCHDHHAIILALGVELPHYLTMIHVAEEAYEGWPLTDWYQERIFNVIDGNFNEQVIVTERKLHWGRLKFAERNLRKDLLKNNILIETKIEGVLVSLVDSQKLIAFLQTKNKNGYPYVP